MAYNDDFTISKGSFSVTLFTTSVSDNFKNKLTAIAGVTSPAKSAEGVKDTKVVDLLRITHTFSLGGVITAETGKTAKEVKDDLISIIKGAGLNGGSPATLQLDGDTFNVYIEDCVFQKIFNDNAAENYTGLDSAEWNVNLTLVEGVSVGG